MPSPKDWESSDPQKPITVNVDDWLANRSGLPPSGIPAPKVEITPTEIEQAKRERRDLREMMLKAAQEAQKAAEVEKENRDCSECGQNNAHYIDDYMCIYCRGKLNA